LLQSKRFKMSNQARRRASKSKAPQAPQRQPASGTFPAAPTRGLADALLEALEQLERAKLATAQRENTEDDEDEDPTLRLDTRRRS
jgi:hypothetical protein